MGTDGWSVASEARTSKRARPFSQPSSVVEFANRNPLFSAVLVRWQLFLFFFSKATSLGQLSKRVKG